MNELNMQSLLGSQQPTQTDDFFKVVKMQYDGTNKNIDMITQLHPTEIVNLCRVQVLDDWCEHRVPAIKVFVQRFMRMKVSESRQGRKEFFDTWKAAGQEQARGSLLKNMLTPRPQDPPM